MLRHETGVLAATAFGKTVVAARGSSPSAASTRSCWSIAASCSTSGLSGSRRSSMYLRNRSVESAEAEVDRLEGLMSASFRVSSERAWSMTASPAMRPRDHRRVPSPVGAQFRTVVRQAKARFVLGLSATVARKDGHHPIIFMQCGPVRHQVNARAQAASRPFEHFVLVQPTRSSRRRPLIGQARRISNAVGVDRRPDANSANLRGRRRLGSQWAFAVDLTERNEHLDRFEHELASRVDHVVVLRAGIGKKQRQAVKPSRGHPAPRRVSHPHRPANTLARDSTTRVWTRCF